MRRLLLILIGIFVIFSVFGADSGAYTQDAQSQTTGFISTGDTLKKLEAKKIEMISRIKIEESREIEGVNERVKLQTMMSELDTFLQSWNTLNAERIAMSEGHNENTALYQKNLTDMISQEQIISTKIVTFARALSYSGAFSGMSFSDLVIEMPSIRLQYLSQISLLTQHIEADQEKRKTLIAESTQQLNEITLEIDRLKHVRNNQLFESMKRFLYYLSIFLILYLTKIISKKVLTRFEKDFSKSHQQAIQMVHRWVFIVLFIITFLVLFLSEFVSLLPFIAIIGTGIGLGLRDVIYSFIAWFAVGSDSGYQEGDIIEVDSIYGRVYTISPILTTIEEYGPQGVTGKLISIPNKTIFEKNIKNWSRTSGYTMLQFEFLFTHESDISRAREILMDIIGMRDLAPYYHARKDIENLKNTYGYAEKDLHPQLHIAHDVRGTMLRAKVLVHVHKRIEEQSRISEEFIMKIQQEKNIHLKEF